jgi:hypothetical protein
MAHWNQVRSTFGGLNSSYSGWFDDTSFRKITCKHLEERFLRVVHSRFSDRGSLCGGFPTDIDHFGTTLVVQVTEFKSFAHSIHCHP